MQNGTLKLYVDDYILLQPTKDSEIEFATPQPERTQQVVHRNFLALQSAFLPPGLHADKQLLSQQHLHPWFPYSTVNNRNQSQ